MSDIYSGLLTTLNQDNQSLVDFIEIFKHDIDIQSIYDGILYLYKNSKINQTQEKALLLINNYSELLNTLNKEQKLKVLFTIMANSNPKEKQEDVIYLFLKNIEIKLEPEEMNFISQKFPHHYLIIKATIEQIELQNSTNDITLNIVDRKFKI